MLLWMMLTIKGFTAYLHTLMLKGLQQEKIFVLYSVWGFLSQSMQHLKRTSNETFNVNFSFMAC